MPGALWNVGLGRRLTGRWTARDTVERLRPTTVRDAMGGTTMTYPTSGPKLPALVQASNLTRTEQAVIGALGAVNLFAVTLRHDADVVITDRLRWTDPTGHAHTLEAVTEGDETVQASKRLLCSEVR